MLGIAGVLAALALGVARRPRAAARLVLRGARRHGGARRAPTCSGRCGTTPTCRSCSSATCRGGSTRCSRSERAGGAGGAGARRAPAERSAHRVRTMAPTLLAFARRRHGGLRAAPARAGARAARAARRLRAAHVHELLPDGPGPARGAARLRAARAPRLLARAGALHHGRGLLVLLLLQDPHRPGSLLDGAAVPAGHPARRAALCRGGGARAARAAAGHRRGCCARDRRGVRRRCSATQFTRAAQPVLPHVEYAGIIPQLEALAGTRRRPRPARRRVAERVRQSRPRAAARLHLRAERPGPQLAEARQGGVRARSSTGRERATTACCSSAAAAPTCCRQPGARAPSRANGSRFPSTTRRRRLSRDSSASKEFDYSLYELTPPDAGGRDAAFDLDVGVNDDLHVVRFHAKELTEGRTFRWSRERSLVVGDQRARRRAATSSCG